jgi:hypothetical protein
VPFSLRPPPKGLRDFAFNNDFAVIPLKLRLFDNFDTGLRVINKEMAALKKSLEPIGQYWLIYTLMQTPWCLRKYLFEDHVMKLSTGFSNVPGPKKPFIVDGVKCKSLAFIMPAGMSITSCISVISHVDTVKVGMTFDKAVLQDPRTVMDRFENNLDEAFGTRWRSFTATNPY